MIHTSSLKIRFLRTRIRSNRSGSARRKYLSICSYFNREIARVQSQWAFAQHRKGVRYPKPSKHIQRLYKKKNDSLNDYLHKLMILFCDSLVKMKIIKIEFRMESMTGNEIETE